MPFAPYSMSGLSTSTLPPVVYDEHAWMSMSAKTTATILPSNLNDGRTSQISSRGRRYTGPLMLP